MNPSGVGYFQVVGGVPSLIELIPGLPTPNAIQSVSSVPSGPSNPVLFISGVIEKQRSGLVLVQALMTGTLVAQEVVTAVLTRDGVTTLFAAQFAPGNVGAFEWTVSIPWLDTLPNDNPHTYELTCSTASTNLTVAAGAAAFSLVEL